MSLRVRRLIARFALVAGLSCLPVHPQEAPSPAAVDIASRLQCCDPVDLFAGARDKPFEEDCQCPRFVA
jgi:hypothetical protein